jgi:hypothetical protein
MWNVVKALLSSKKFVAGFVGVGAAAAAKLGLSWEVDEILTVLSPLLAAIIGQGWADTGKEAKKLEIGK